ncbi:predicted protein [Postia placenta Mad-698-R]|nr:predicted protein [Postia placenta Mad-698-R]
MTRPAARHDLIPGTVHLVDIGGGIHDAKHDSNHRDIVLVPRPSSDPEDPLNWPRRRKLLAISMVYLYAGIGLGISTALQYSVLADITRDTGITTAELVQGTGLMFLFLGWACLIWQPIALTYGRRGIYVLSCLFGVPLMVWTAYSTSAGEWYAHRILLGIVASAGESLPEVSVFDLFFAHERGAYMAFYVFTIFASNFVAPLLAGWFNDAYGWRWTMQFGAMVTGVTAVILFFFMEETIYFRKTVEGDELEASDARRSGEGAANVTFDEKDSKSADDEHIVNVTPSPHLPPRTYWQKLALFTRKPGRPSNKQMFKMMYRPLIMMYWFPCTDWAGFLYGINLSWYNVLNGTASPVLSAPPYNWSPALVGSAYTAPIIGAIFAAIWSGTIADRFTIYLARRNGGVREPEQRLWPLVVSGTMATAGLITWGVGAYYGISWVGLCFGLAMLTFGVVTGGSIAVSYNVDCFKELGGETTISVIVIRNTLGFGFSYAITPWYTNQGLKNCFIAAGFISLACTFTFLFMIVYGKRLRKFSRDKYWEYVATSAVGH